ncbi:MAG: ABC transporter ATP-binding protein [Proteobacteria bacterium]|nr:ABC transporter ATP-binding protein [Pseudomonadota bacterium]
MLEVKNLKVKRGNFNLNIDKFYLKPGSINLVLGPNGGGKTTLLKSLAGLIDYRGEISLEGKKLDDINFKDRAKIFGYLSQGIYLSELFVRDFLILGRFPYTSLMSRYTKSDWDKVYKASEIFDLGEYLYRDVTTLSQGELQRVMLAKVFVQEPDILLLDEPTTALDIGFKELVKKQIYKYLELRPESIVVISTHEPSVFMDKTDMVLMLKHGKVFGFGEKNKVYNEANIKKLFNLS